MEQNIRLPFFLRKTDRKFWQFHDVRLIKHRFCNSLFLLKLK